VGPLRQGRNKPLNVSAAAQHSFQNGWTNHLNHKYKNGPYLSLIRAQRAMQIAQTISETDYAQALAEIRRLIEGEPDRRSPDGDRLDALAALAEAYEAEIDTEASADIECR
jgi:hypothetical protein